MLLLLHLRTVHSGGSKRLVRTFSVYSNQRQQLRQVVQGKEIIYDYNIDRYETASQAYLQKRRTRKEEVPPKIYITDTLPCLETDLERVQQLVPLSRLYDMERMQKMRSLNVFDSQFVISKLCEEYFKTLMDQYLRKVVVCGRTVPLAQYAQYERDVRQRVLALYNVFFYGDKQSDLEYHIELRYLNFKQQKFLRYVQTEKPGYKCLWTYTQQKRVEWLVNYHARDLNLYDDFRPIYERVRTYSTLGEQLLVINSESFIKRLLYRIFEARYYKPVSQKRFSWVGAYQLTRIQLYVDSIEFTNLLQIPADFHIEHSIINMHVWLIQDSLRNLGKREGILLSKQLEISYQQYTLDRVNKIHLKKKNDFIKDVNYFMKTNRQAFDRHFNELYKDDPYKKIDALVWSAVFFEKVPRYSEQVYLMAEYLVQNHRYLRSLPLSDFLECAVNFDVFLIDFQYKERILQSSPQLSKEEFEEEFASDKKVKKYYYKYQEEPQKITPPTLPIDDDAQLQRVNPVVNKAAYSIFSVFRKFQTLETYDYHSEQEAKRKEEAKKYQKYVWKQDGPDSEDRPSNKKGS